MANILIPYYDYQPRTTTTDHTYCFKRYGNHNAFFINIANWRPPGFLASLSFDLIVYGTVFVGQRWTLSHFKWFLDRCKPLKSIKAPGVAIPQDECVHSDALCDFINEFGISHVFTCADSVDWGNIYNTVDRKKVGFTQVLTGYLDDATVIRINALNKPGKTRHIDVGYRAWNAVAWVGRHGLLKRRIADEFARLAPQRGLVSDISNRPEDMLMGDNWYKFLLRCRYTIGVEGGASLLDRDGAIRTRTDAFVATHPAASFDEIEAACFPGLDGNLSLFAISPRHLEACATRTCQVLIEGNYNGFLKPDRHYIELKKDFSNIENVLSSLKKDDLRGNIVENAYQDIVASRICSYEQFVNLVVSRSLGNRAPIVLTGGMAARNMTGKFIMDFGDLISRTIGKITWLYPSIKPYLPSFIIHMAKRARGK